MLSSLNIQLAFCLSPWMVLVQRLPGLTAVKRVRSPSRKKAHSPWLQTHPDRADGQVWLPQIPNRLAALRLRSDDLCCLLVCPNFGQGLTRSRSGYSANPCWSSQSALNSQLYQEWMRSRSSPPTPASKAAEIADSLPLVVTLILIASQEIPSAPDHELVSSRPWTTFQLVLRF